MVQELCTRESIIFEVIRMDIAQLATDQKLSIEATARRERYKFFEATRAKYNAKYILTAHHRDDQGETILMNLIK